MNELQLALFLLVGGFSGHYLLRRSGDVGIWLMRTFKFGWANNPKYTFLNNRGEAPTGAAPVEIPKEFQPVVDTIVQTRLAREREKYSDYEELRKFRDEHNRGLEQQKQKELESQKNYEEAKKGYESKIGEYSQKLSAKDQEIQNLKIDYALTGEVSRQNGFIEESIALLKNSVTVGTNGELTIKGKDANGIDITMPLADGVKKFYEQRPHLLRSTHKAGAGTGAGDGAGTGVGAGSGQVEDLNSLNAQLVQASSARDFKKMGEIRQKINTVMIAKGIRR